MKRTDIHSYLENELEQTLNLILRFLDAMEEQEEAESKPYGDALEISPCDHCSCTYIVESYAEGCYYCLECGRIR